MQLRAFALSALRAGLMGAVAAGFFPAMTFGAGPAYKVAQQWKLEGGGGWDYLTVDPSAHLLYITRGDRVALVDETTGKQIGEIGGLQGVHGVALDGRGRYGYISDGRANQIVVFDRRTREKVAQIPAGTNPDGIVFDPKTETVWAFNGRSNNATVVDTKSNKAIATVALPGRPEFPVADGRGTVFVNIEDKSELVRIDAFTHQATATWPLAPCESPSGLAMDTAHRRVFSVCDGGKMAVVDADSGKVVATPAIGEGPDAAAFDAKRQLAFSSNGGSGTLTVVKEESPNSFQVVENVPTQRGARTMALDPDSGRVYLVTAQFGPRPAATADNPHPRPSILPNTFTILVVEPQGM